MARFAVSSEAPPPGPQQEILRVKAGNYLEAISLSAKIQGIWQHWCTKGKGYSLPCLDPESACVGCQNKLPRRWKGYLWCDVLGMRKKGFVEITPGVAADMTTVIGDASWRGVRFRLMRGDGIKAHVRADVKSMPSDALLRSLGEDKSILPLLIALWKKSGFDASSLEISERPDQID